MRKAALFAFLVAAAAVAPPALGCSEAPENALISLPEPVGEWARVACTEEGYAIMPKLGWSWISHMTRRPLIFPARLGGGLSQGGEDGSYFVSSSVEVLEGTSAFMTDLFLEEVFRQVGQDIPSEKPVTYDVTLKNNEGQEVAIFFYVFKDLIVGTSCWESCLPVHGFSALNIGQE